MEVGASDTFRVHIEAFPPAAHRQFRSVMMESIHSYVGLHRYIAEYLCIPRAGAAVPFRAPALPQDIV